MQPHIRYEDDFVLKHTNFRKIYSFMNGLLLGQELTNWHSSPYCSNLEKSFGIFRNIWCENVPSSKTMNMWLSQFLGHL